MCDPLAGHVLGCPGGVRCWCAARAFNLRAAILRLDEMAQGVTLEGTDAWEWGRARRRTDRPGRAISPKRRRATSGGRQPLDRSKAYVFLLRSRDGAEFIARRVWNGRRWKTERLYPTTLVGSGPWRVLLGDGPFWRRGPRMVLEVPAWLSAGVMD